MHSLQFNNDIKVNTKKPSLQNRNIIDNLGQIEYIFCDKTGTLTDSNMVLEKCSVGDKIFNSLEHVRNAITGLSGSNQGEKQALFDLMTACLV